MAAETATHDRSPNTCAGPGDRPYRRGRSGLPPASKRGGGAMIRALILCALLAGCGPQTTQQKYEALQDWYAEQGLLRTDYDPADAPFSRDDLVRNFQKIAFHSEFAPGEKLRQEETPTELFKWTGGLSWSIDGDGVGPTDIADMQALIARLAAATGLTFTQLTPQDDASPDVSMLVLGARTRELVIGLLSVQDTLRAVPLIKAWSAEDRFPCIGQIGLVRHGANAGTLRAFIFIKAETTRLLRKSCLHEEFTQVLGLLNDGDDVRPSIFNDGQEFALLTRHDEMLLRILYDPRLKPGMTEAEGMPIVRRIAAELEL
ncbi:MAG: hypothetical protein ACI807_000452 [Paracoccaceae bacterium]|jgi:hypothetical protein